MREQALAALADTAALHDMQAGWRWRPMSDTTKDPIIVARAPLPWPSWQRSEDHYTKGALVWLDVDTRIRKLTGETRPLDDFARAFFGNDEQESGVTDTYKFDDIVRLLTGIAEHGWSSFFIDKLHNTQGHAPWRGLNAVGTGWSIATRRQRWRGPGRTSPERATSSIRSACRSGRTVQ